MIVGEGTAEKLVLSDFIQPIYDPAAESPKPVVGFLDGEGRMMFSIPTRSVAEAVELTNRFQSILEMAMNRLDYHTPEERIVTEFSRLYYAKCFMDGDKLEAQTFAHYKGLQIQKCPLDLQVYQEIIWECRPDLIIECGTATGASALWLADLLDNFGMTGSRVLTIDIVKCPRLSHPKIFYLTGSTLGESVQDAVKEHVRNIGYKNIMVILDDDHHADHVLKELEFYSQFVSTDQYLIVEDTNVNHPIMHGYGAGPKEALDKWLPTRQDFIVDRTREKFMMTWNPGGYLRRVL